MGCDSPGSNFNSMVYYEGAWGCTFGPLGFEAPNEALIRQEMARLGLDTAEWNIAYDETRQTWRAVRQTVLPVVTGTAADRHLQTDHGWAPEAVAALHQHDGSSPAGAHNMLHWPGHTTTHRHSKG